MDKVDVTLTSQEREFLIELLQTALKQTLVEEHRTRVLAYRVDVLRREELLNSLLEKVAGEIPTAM